MVEQQKCEDFLYKHIKYENCELYINIIFYVLSYMDFELIDESYDQLLKIIENCFQLNSTEVNELRETYYSKT
jgi:hypothetical protein